MTKILAFDLGASSGRAMLGSFDGKKITMRELHRFTNDPVSVKGVMYWDILRLLFEIKTGITKAVNHGGFDCIGIDTWGVDFGLINKEGHLIDNPVHYRDSRTDDYAEFFNTVSKDEIYNATGIQDMQINTLHQLISINKKNKSLMDRTYKMLFTPDLLNYFLTGEMKTEYTIASTSQLLEAKERNWDFDLIKKAGLRDDIFADIVMPGTICGKLSDEICKELGAPKVDVVCIASHDTASAVASTPTAKDDFIYISCGTWSLLGTEIKEPIRDENAKKYDFTNEGGVNNTIRFLKNIMGTWLIQESRRQWIREGNELGFSKLEEMAKECEPFKCFVDVDHKDFIKPGNIPERIKAYCKSTNQYVPQSIGEIVRCIDESLAMKYKYNILAVQDCTKINYDVIHLLGGGAQSKLLCQMTADANNKQVIAGPTEATVLGNIAVQLMAKGELKDFKQVREVVKNSYELSYYKPSKNDIWEDAYKRFLNIVKG